MECKDCRNETDEFELEMFNNRCFSCHIDTLEGYTMSVTTINGSQPWIHTVFYATHEEQESTNATTIRVRDETDYKWWVNWQEKKVYWTYTYDLLGCRHTIDVEEIT